MNKQLINKYKPEFDHWLNEGSILARVITSDEDDFMYTIWYVVDSNDLEKWKAEYLFNLTNTQIEFYKPQFIINDKYVEFRKALAEGKTVQCNAREGQNDITYTAFGHNWWVDTTEFKYATNFYRIKPDEPKFKVGDFVRYVNSSNSLALEINNINCDRYYFVNSNISCLEHKLIPWEPIKGEWCWFYDKASNKYSHLAKFNEMWKNKFRSTTDTPWQFCEPFLNSLPSYLKDK